MSRFENMKILVVDDETGMTKLLKILLEEELQCEVTTMNDSVDALQLLEKTEFDVISLDHTMPRMTGIGLLKKLRNGSSINKHTPVLIFTGYLEDAKTADPQVYENTLLLEKPMEDDRYLRNVKIAYGMKIKKAP